MKKQFSKVALLAVGACLTFSACNNSPYPGYDLAENGVYVKFHEQDEAGVKPKENDIVRLIMSYKNNKDSVLFDSQKGNPSGKNYIEFPLGKSTFKGSFEDALSLMSVGDSASFMISADSVYLKTFMAPELPPYIEKGSMLTFDAKLVKIVSKDEVEKENQKRQEEQRVMMELQKNEEMKKLGDYLAANKITAKPTASGLYYIESKKGNGPKPTAGSVVKVAYVGRLIDGTLFDTSDEELAKKEGIYDERRGKYEPIEFPVGTGQVIPGWDEGLMLMNKGSKGKMIIPSNLAYGDGGGRMTPYATLIFDVELVDIKDAPKSK